MLFGDKIKSYDLIILFGIVGLISFTIIGTIFYDKLKIKTNLTKHDGKNNEYWNNRLTPLQQKTQLMLLECIEDSKKIRKYKQKLKKGYL